MAEFLEQKGERERRESERGAVVQPGRLRRSPGFTIGYGSAGPDGKSRERYKLTIIALYTIVFRIYSLLRSIIPEFRRNHIYSLVLRNI